MLNINLISIVHKESGMCNSSELLKIIEKISPDVIYEELSPNLFSTFYKESGNSTLETSAIKNYLTKKPIPHIPVDLNGDELVDKKLKNKISRMLEIFRNDFEYRNLLYIHNAQTSRLGFPYLNSNECMEFFERSVFIEKILLRKMNNPELTKTYEVWSDINERRENSMIKNIYKYGNENKPKKALFLIGSAHRKSIINKAKKIERKSELKFNWIINQ